MCQTATPHWLNGRTCMGAAGLLCWNRLLLLSAIGAAEVVHIQMGVAETSEGAGSGRW